MSEIDPSIPTCRICGCTEDHACEGGCYWVLDPENLGDLCSQCLANGNHVWEIPLEQIRPAFYNPPSRLDPERVKELADSMLKEGQQSPALIRPVEAEPPVRYEMVWGHRRCSALNLLNQRIAAGAELSPETAPEPFRLKTFIREMTEEQAMISSGIENLQREGFSDIEEAEFFRTCAERYGDSAVKDLTEKLCISDRYIRKRLEVLKLPAAALELWRSGAWHIGHMEQLLRLGGHPEVEAFLKETLGRHQDPDDWPVWELKDRIDHLAVPLHASRFDKTECKVCTKNSDLQFKLFGGDKEKGAKCLDSACYQAKEQAWLDLNWADCKQNKYGTRAALIGDYNVKITGIFGRWEDYQPGEKCLTCQHFATIISLSGRQLHTYHNQVCLGPANCFKSVKRAGQKSNKTKVEKGNGAGEPEGPRVVWHGEHFRQEFYQQEIPHLLENLGPDDLRPWQLNLACLIASCDELSAWLYQKLGRTVPEMKHDWQTFRLRFPQILNLAGQIKDGLQKLIAEALIEITLHTGYGNGNWNCRLSFIDSDRQALADFLDIDFARFQVSEEYLQKKTKAELVRFITKDSGLLEESRFQEFMAQQGFPTAEKLAGAKKPQLIELIQNCGVDLHGRLPAEIADLPKFEPGDNQ